VSPSVSYAQAILEEEDRMRILITYCGE